MPFLFVFITQSGRGSATTLSIMTLAITGFYVTLKINITRQTDIEHYDECHYAASFDILLCCVSIDRMSLCWMSWLRPRLKGLRCNWSYVHKLLQCKYRPNGHSLLTLDMKILLKHSIGKRRFQGRMLGPVPSPMSSHQLVKTKYTTSLHLLPSFNACYQPPIS